MAAASCAVIGVQDDRHSISLGSLIDVLRPSHTSHDRPKLLVLADSLANEELRSPLENWTIVGEFTSRAAAKVALTVLVLMQLTAGSANSLALA